MDIPFDFASKVVEQVLELNRCQWLWKINLAALIRAAKRGQKLAAK